MLAGLVPKDREQDAHTQQDCTKDKEEKDELADMSVPLVSIWLSSSDGRHDQERKGLLDVPRPEGEMRFLPSSSFRLCKQKRNTELQWVQVSLTSCDRLLAVAEITKV